jgi:hypothetical protein
MVCVMRWARCSASYCGSAAVEPSSKVGAMVGVCACMQCLVAQLHVLCAVTSGMCCCGVHLVSKGCLSARRAGVAA